MFCNKCGLPLKDNETVCPNCGTEVKKEEMITKNNQNEADNVTAQENAPAPAKKKKVRIGLLAGIGVCVAAVLLLVLNFSAITHTVRRTITSPASYYRYVEKQNTIKAAQNLVTSAYAQSPEDWGDFYANTTTTIELNDYVLNLVSALTGLDDLDWLQYIGLNASVNMQNDRMQTDMALMLGEEAMLSASPLISMSMLHDAPGEMIYMQVPELSSHYIGMKAENVEEEAPSMQDMYEILPNAQEINTLVERYFRIFFSHIEQVEKSKEVLQTEGLTKEVYALSAVIDAEALKTALLEIIAEAKQDEMILTFLRDLDNLGLAGAGVSLEQEFMSAAEEWETELMGWDTGAVTDSLRMTVYLLLDLAHGGAAARAVVAS